MCDPVSLFIAGAAATAYSTNRAQSAAKDQRGQMEKQARRQKQRAQGEALQADSEQRKTRAEGYSTRRTAKAAARTQSAGTAQSFGPRSFFATA